MNAEIKNRISPMSSQYFTVFLVLFIAFFALSACTIPPSEMQKLESDWTGQGGDEGGASDCDYVEDALSINPKTPNEWFMITLPADLTAGISLYPRALIGQSMGIATFMHESFTYIMDSLSKIIFLMLNAAGAATIISVAATLMVIFWGIGVLLGYTNESTRYAFAMNFLRMALVMYFATNWELFSSIVSETIESFIHYMSILMTNMSMPKSSEPVYVSATGIIASMQNVCDLDPTRRIPGTPSLDGFGLAARHSDVSALIGSLPSPSINITVLGMNLNIDPSAMLSEDRLERMSFFDQPGPFCLMDYTFSQLWNFKFVKLIMASMLAGFAGWIYGFLLVSVLVGYIIAMYSAFRIYIISYIFRALLYAIAPIFITFALFKQTKSLFDGWVQQIISFTIQPIFVFAYLGFFQRMITEFLRISLEKSDPDISSAAKIAGVAQSTKAEVCYGKFTQYNELTFYWWQFRVGGAEKDGDGFVKYVAGVNPDLPFNLGILLIVAILIYILGGLLSWVSEAATSISQGFISAAGVGTSTDSRDPDSKYNA